MTSKDQNILENSKTAFAEANGDLEKISTVFHDTLAGFEKQLEINQHLKKTIQYQTQKQVFESDKLARVIELGVSMSSERIEARLLSLILEGAQEIAMADGATLYVRSANDDLNFRVIRNDTLNIRAGGENEVPPDLPPVNLYHKEDGKPNHHNVVSHAVHAVKTINIEDAYHEDKFDFSGTRDFDKASNYRSKSFLTVPLTPRGGEVIGALQLINALDPDTNKIVPFNEEVQSFVELLAAQAAVALENYQLIDAQEELLDSFIEVMAGSIDAKSPYTGGHCARVPELGIMLTDEASLSNELPFADFAFTTDAEKREFRIGAYLHDCGKVTTPEYVVDKATKLETIYNRIHEVRTRFEILLRDYEIEYLQTSINASDDKKAFLKLARDQKIAQLHEDFTMIAESNVGSEFMNDDKIARLGEIAKTTWMRHFDNRLGVSQGELGRFSDEPPDLPCEEPLLADRQDHIMPRSRHEKAALNATGYSMTVPEHFHNFGELYNLSIQRGTLNDEERFIINDHIVQTLMMLNRMPFPKHQSRIAEYAGTHHEKLDGTGYPRGLSEDELSIPARIMAVADVFEALTATDRPYKLTKTLNESIRILSFMVKDRHLDGDVFKLLMTSGIYKKYADRFMLPAQIDEVDVEAYTKGL